ncbi:HAD-IIB family hydrolase [Gilvimarinus sp. F26214L]|uniref:HAD-IIB family hydrolase n=1 Tax=Gilvimarinus sp. DZF01 TaxID=3461371 RepID=UPI0040461E7D
MSQNISDAELLTQFVAQEQLPGSYTEAAEQWFLPLAKELARAVTAGRLKVLGIVGTQGSGKSTLAALLETILHRRHGLKVCRISLDDFYLSRAEREALAATVHPLLATRGVPGTHDVSLALATLDCLQRRDEGDCALPRFDKARDDRRPQAQWPHVRMPVDLVILEGWCLAATAQSEQELIEPINILEAEEDTDGRWRRYVNERLREDYPPLFRRIDKLVALRAPGFDCVLRWRQKQEEKLSPTDGDRIMSGPEIERFVQHFERITRHNLAQQAQIADVVFELDANQNVTARHNRSSGPQIPVGKAPESTAPGNQAPANQAPERKPSGDDPPVNMQAANVRNAVLSLTSNWLVVSDLDGTLLDHHDYSHAAAASQIAELEERGIPLVFNTSKTFAELGPIRDRLGNRHPFVVENGSAIYFPPDYFANPAAGASPVGSFQCLVLGTPREELQAWLQRVSSAAYRFRSFADMQVDEVMSLTGLNQNDARLAMRRDFSEVIQWLDSEERRELFCRQAEAAGFRTLLGGRFLHLLGPCDKGMAALRLVTEYRSQRGGAWSLIAAGDSGNDVAMLEAADLAILVRSPVQAFPELATPKGVIHSERFGPAGWAEVMDALLQHR